MGGEEREVGSVGVPAKELTDYIRRLDELPVDAPIPEKKAIVHCPCGTGCPECYGKLNCGCPDCYVPELKRGKKKSVTLSMVDMAHMPAILELEYSFCTVSQVMEEKATATKVSVRTQEGRKSVVLKTRNRWSMPVIPTPIKEKEPPKKKDREPLEARRVGPPKQVKYFCKNCNVDVCNACFSSVCSGHQVQWIGSAFFHCASPYHKIVHEAR